ncbi:MAG: IS630 family transposase [Betaproteobacteria bacterium]
MKHERLRITPTERKKLQKVSRLRSARAEMVQRARLILMLAEGNTYAEVEKALGCSSPYITRWKRRFLKDHMRGLSSRYVGGQARVRTPALEAKILEKTRSQPSDGSTHWSTRKLAAALGVSHMMVARVWARAGLQPHRLERYMASDDPDFERKAADIIGLYLNPPRHAAIFCLDEKSHIQALDRLDPVLPLSPGRAERHGFEYYRHGTLSLYAALDTRSGEVLGKPVARHTSEEFIAFLREVIDSQPKGKEIHVILDNLSAHKSAAVREFLEGHPQVHFHFTPTYSSWLNQVEIWFAKIERDVIARGVFTSVADLARKLMRYIRHHNKHARPIRWTYRDTSRRITYDSAVTGH